MKTCITRNLPEKNAPPRGALGPPASYKHAVDSVSKFVPIETCMQSFMKNVLTATEHGLVKGRLRPDFFPNDRSSLVPSAGITLRAEAIQQLLYELFLFGSKQYNACSTSHVQLVVNRQPGYRQGTRRASHCVPVFLCVL